MIGELLMNLDQYPIISDSSHLNYKFESIGHKGIIKKAVKYTAVTSIGKNIYNLSFGDLNKISGEIDDTVVSNNNDTNKILLTVGLTSLLFANHFPNAEILIVGSTISRTRLYQMAINQNVIEIGKFFDLKGFRNGNWGKFKAGINFEAFLVTKKLNNL
jgi:uncharacterized protein involved in outer membrane biogenesis